MVSMLPRPFSDDVEERRRCDNIDDVPLMLPLLDSGCGGVVEESSSEEGSR